MMELVNRTNSQKVLGRKSDGERLWWENEEEERGRL
jgi:hypothetical protein